MLSSRSTTKPRVLCSLGIIIALWSASAAVRMTMHVLNVAYGAEEERPAC
ncbi:MAG: YihY/virulence factor BrkB family protein [Actinomycetota bacterium]|nr:YihY/virulence factor BrkB family protein [Actinomycetota bacterium]